MKARDARPEDYKKLQSVPYFSVNEEKHWSEHVEFILSTGARTICEVGCGRGLFTKTMSEQSQITMALGTDIIEHKEWDSDNCRKFMVASAFNWPDTLVRTDLICSFDVLEHLPEDKIEQAIDEMNQRGRMQFHVVWNGPDTRTIEGEKVELHITQRPFAWWASMFVRVTGRPVERVPCAYRPKFRFGIFL